jgi:hypothetical protein
MSRFDPDGKALGYEDVFSKMAMSRGPRVPLTLPGAH